MTRYNKEKFRLVERKRYAHALIRVLVEMGLPKHKVYMLLAKKLNLTLEECHFALMETRTEVDRAVDVLRQIKINRLQYLSKHKTQERAKKKKKKDEAIAKKKERKVLSQGEMRKLTAAVGNMNEEVLKNGYAGKFKGYVFFPSSKERKHPIISKYFPFLLQFIK
jgi:hypothetical protein